MLKGVQDDFEMEFDDFYRIYCNLDREQPYPKNQDKKTN